MSNEPDPAEEQNPFEPPDETAGPMPPPPPPRQGTPNYYNRPGDPRRYDSKVMWRTAGIVIAVIAVATWLVPFVGLLVPVILFVALFFLLAKDQTVRYRSTLAGILLGLGIGLFVTAGICSAVFSGNLPTPMFPTS